MNSINGIFKGNKDQDRLCEEHLEDHFCDEDGRVSQASQGSDCHREQTSI